MLQSLEQNLVEDTAHIQASIRGNPKTASLASISQTPDKGDHVFSQLHSAVILEAASLLQVQLAIELYSERAFDRRKEHAILLEAMSRDKTFAFGATEQNVRVRKDVQRGGSALCLHLFPIMTAFLLRSSLQ